MSITFSSCFYIIKSKFDPKTYTEWMNNFLSIVNNFNLVIYTDEQTSQFINKNTNINTTGNPKIKLIIRPFESFYMYKYKNDWIENHKKNSLLNDKVEWQVNMLWSEKIWFVNETIQKKYFETDFYGWCDIGYFRNRPGDLHTNQLSNWANHDKIWKLDKTKVMYACINNDDGYMSYLHKIVNNKNRKGLPDTPIPAHQNSIAGGFFILYKDNIEWWSKTFENKLQLYFKNKYLVKDDQIILVDCILSGQEKFVLFRENQPNFDNWFMFQRILY